MTIRQIPISIGALAMLIIGIAPATAQPARDREPCGQIIAACQSAGFTVGGAPTSGALLADCILPTMQGAAQPGGAGKPLPQIDPRLIAACQAANPSFGQGRAAPTEVSVPAKPAALLGISTVNLIDAHRVGRPFDTGDPTLNAYANPNTSGVTFRTSWADVELTEGNFDFAKIDDVFASAEKNGKWVELILIPGFGTPGWAMQGTQTGMFAIPYGPGRGMLLPLPAPWDQTYLSRWFAFLKVIGDRYSGRASFRKIAAAGPTSVSAEMALPDSPDDIIQWQRLGYTSQKYIEAWKRTFSAYSSTFPRQYFSLALHSPLPIPDRRQNTSVQEQIISLGLQYPGQFALQEDGLTSAQTDKIYGYRVVRDHSGQVATGFMMDTSATQRSERPGFSGDPVSDLRLSMDAGLTPNNKGTVIKYLEVYEADIVNPSMQQVLEQAEQQLKESAPLASP